MQQFASQHTFSFAEFLRQAGVSLVVSTYQAGRLVLIRPQAEGVNTHFIAMNKPMGIAADAGQRLAIGDAHRIEFFRNLPAVADKLDDVGVDAVYLHRATQVSGDIDVHEMGYDRDGQLWVVNTRMSCLCTLAAEFSVVPRWKPPFISTYDLLDRCHLNGLGLRDGKPRYVSMLGDGDTAESWRAGKSDGGLIMDIEDSSVVVDRLCMPHSPRWHDGALWFLASGSGSLHRLDAQGRPACVVELPGFTRGLDFIGRFALVGLSRVRETAVFAGLPLTRSEAERHCGIYLVDTHASRVVGFLHFTGDIDEVFAVQCLPHRMPVVLGAESPLLASSYELPQAALQSVAPTDPVLAQLAEAARLHMDGEHEKVIALCRSLLAIRPGLMQARRLLGLALKDAGHWQEGRDVLVQVVATQVDDAIAFDALGVCCSRLGEWTAALDWFERALSLDQQFGQARRHRDEARQALSKPAPENGV